MTPTNWHEQVRNSYGKIPKRTPRSVREEDIRLQELKDKIALAKLRLTQFDKGVILVTMDKSKR